MSAAHPYELLAGLLCYPAPATVALASACRAALEPRCAGAAAAVGAFADAVSGLELRDQEELFVRTFDLSPSATLDLGFQLFGESYKRGIFLVKMQQAARAHGVDPGSELPDHLPVVLRLLARLEERDEPRALADEVILPAVAKVIGVLDAPEGRRTPYIDLLRATVALLKADFDIDTIRDLPRNVELPVDGRRDGKRRLEVLPGFTAEPLHQEPRP